MEPRLFFKYKSLAKGKTKKNTLDILKNNRLYFSHRENLNDPMEGCYTPITYAYAGWSISNITEDEPIPSKEERDKYRILSLSETCFSPQMWAYYADSYKGVCFGFYPKSFKNLQKVIYSDSNKNIVHEPNNLREIIFNDYVHKHIDWQHEKEWRIVSNTGDDYLSFSRRNLACIIVGYKISSTTLKQIKKLSNDTPIFKIYAGKTSFELKLLEIDHKCQYDGFSPPFINNIKELENYLKKSVKRIKNNDQL